MRSESEGTNSLLPFIERILPSLNLSSLKRLKDRPPIPFSGISFAEYFNGAWIFFVALKIAHLPAWIRAFFHLDRIEMKAGRG